MITCAKALREVYVQAEGRIDAKEMTIHENSLRLSVVRKGWSMGRRMTTKGKGG